MCIVPSLYSVVFYPYCVGVCGVVCLLSCYEESSSPVPMQLQRGDMDLYEVPLAMSLLAFGVGIMLANFHMCGIMFLLTAVLNMLVRNEGICVLGV